MDTETISIEFEGTSRPFILPADPNMRAILREIFEHKVYSVPPYMRERTTCVIDVGANIGASALFFTLAYPRAKIVCFESNPLPLPLLHINLEGIERASVYEYGLSDSEGELPMGLQGAGGECSSIKENNAPFKSDYYRTVEIREALPHIEPHLEGQGPAVLKVDTEGCEIEILRNIEPLMERFEVIHLEYHSEDDRRRTDAFLCDRGFLLYSSDASHCHRGDVTYVRETIVRQFDPYTAYAIS